MYWFSLLTSGHTFNENTYELKLKYILFNLMLIFNAIMVGIMMYVRLSRGEYPQAIADMLYIFFGIFSFVLARKSKKYFPFLIIFVIFYSYLVTSASFYTSHNPYTGTSWFIVLMIITFFLRGRSAGIIIFIISQITMLLIIVQKGNSNIENVFVSMIPFYSIFFFMLFFEKRNSEFKKILEQQKEDFKYKANYDYLTDIPNRALFNDRLVQYFKQLQRNELNLAVCFIDINKFKNINDSLGHEVGDKVLKELVRRLSTQIRSSDTLARLGGDEFAVIIDNFTTKEDIVKIVDKFFEVMKAPFRINEYTLKVTISVGIAVASKECKDSSMLMKEADKAMYDAKNEGGNQYYFSTY